MAEAKIYRPDNQYLRLFAALFLFLLLTSGKWLMLFLFIWILILARKRSALVIDAFHATAFRHPFSGEQIIIPRDRLRAHTGSRKFGPCLILADTTSVQEIALYDWVFRPKTLLAIRREFDSDVSS